MGVSPRRGYRVANTQEGDHQEQVRRIPSKTPEWWKRRITYNQ